MRIGNWIAITGLLAAAGSIRAGDSAGSAGAEPAPPMPAVGVLNLVAGDVQTASRANLLLEQPAAFAPHQRYVLQFDGPLSRQERRALSDLGVALGDYLPTYAHIADLSAATPTALAQLDFLQWVGPYDESWKLAADLDEREFASAERRELQARGEAALHVTLFEGADAAAARAELAALASVSIVGAATLAGNDMLYITAPLYQASAIAALPAVQFIEHAPEVTLRSNTNRWIVQSNLDGVTPLYDAGLHGEGQIIGILDSRIDHDHCAFFDGAPIGPDHRKILAYNTSFGSYSHGTHVAGIAVGDAYQDDNNRGIAYLGKLVYDTTPSFGEYAVQVALAQHHDQGARIHSNSWGNDSTTLYDSLCRGFDAFLYEYEESAVMLAVTNGSTLKNPENAKNLLAVGASQDAPGQHLHCSGGTGPTSDGRRKPEIYAPGCSTVAARNDSSCGTTAKTGTSMACPAVAATGMLVRQYYAEGFYPSGSASFLDAFVPSGALVKATLLNSAVDMTGISGYPSNREGWGRVLADDALHFAGEERTLLIEDVFNADGLSTGEAFERSFHVTGSEETLKVTLVYTEPPAAAGASFASVNDLDLEVVAPDQSLFLGNVFADGQSQRGGAKDDRNNVEQVHLDAPSVGEWTVRVTAAGVNEGTQGFALVITGQVSDSAPCSGDLNGDGQVNQSDLGLLLISYEKDAGGDIDGDGDTDQSDLGLLLIAYEKPCP